MQSCAIFLFVEEIELWPKDARLYCMGSVQARNSLLFYISEIFASNFAV